MNFTAIDFETANYQPNSACSLALIVVRDNHIVNQFYTLINPEHHFEARNTAIHHITASMVVDAPKFPTVWPHIAPLFTAKQLIVAHNHPHTDATPSTADNLLTYELKKACDLIDLSLVDHIIVGRNETLSYAESCLAPFG